jgi:hypothetical protein
VQKQTARLGFMHKFDSAGNRNFIDFSGNPTIDRAFWDAYLTNADASKRLYLTSKLENVTHPVNERTTEEFDSGRIVETRPEYLGFQGHAIDEDAVSELKAQYNKNKCADLVFFHITNDGAFIGDAKTFADDQLLYGIPVQEGSFHVGRTLATDSETSKLVIGFNYDRFFDDANMNGISESLMTDGILDIPAVTLVKGVATNPAVTGFTLELATIFLNGYSNSPITGLTPSQIIVTEVGGATVSISSADENPDGTYDVAATLGSGTDYDITLDVTNHIMAPVRISVA